MSFLAVFNDGKNTRYSDIYANIPYDFFFHYLYKSMEIYVLDC